MTNHEKLGIRCSEISQRHRLYGADAPACDLDFLLIEYDHAEPVALFEHKFWRGGPKLDLDLPSLKAFASLATRAELPAFVAQYNVSTWMYRVYPANQKAKDFVTRTRWMTEREYASLLYQLRGKIASTELLASLKGDPFEEDDDLPENPIPDPARANESLATILDEPWVEWDEEILTCPA